jgi:RNA polymerase sigma factor (sigma-70 family)
MPTDDTRKQWSEAKQRFALLNDLAATEAMGKNRESEYWKLCDELVRHCVQIYFSKHPEHPVYLKEEAAQETMSSVYKSLDKFRYECLFTTWVSNITRNRVIDTLRRYKTHAKREVYADEPPEGHEENSPLIATPKSQTPEEITLAKEQEREVKRAIFVGIEAFLQKSKNPEFNRQILDMAFGEGCNYKEIVRRLNNNASEARIGYVVRSAREYLRQLLSDHEKPFNNPENYESEQ